MILKVCSTLAQRITNIVDGLKGIVTTIGVSGAGKCHPMQAESRTRTE